MPRALTVMPLCYTVAEVVDARGGVLTGDEGEGPDT